MAQVTHVRVEVTFTCIMAHVTYPRDEVAHVFAVEAECDDVVQDGLEANGALWLVDHVKQVLST